MNTKPPIPGPTAPPHCPNCNCKYHNPQTAPWPCVRFGSFRRDKPPYVIQRYRCLACGRTFSDQTFTVTYWLKRPEILLQVHKHAVSGAANSQIARILGVATATVDNHLARLGRHSLVFHSQFMASLSPRSDIAIDGLVTFENSQYLPYEIVASVDRSSSLVLHFAEAERRRSGTMTDHQRHKRMLIERDHGRPDPKSVLKAAVEVLEVSLRGAARAIVWSDLHKTYPYAVARIKSCRIEHCRVDSKAPRTSRNPLFEENRLDMMIRHCLKDHTRETIAFGKRRQHSMYRMAIYVVWNNYIKLRRERRCQQTPAMEVGLLDRRLTEEDVLARRLFVSQVTLPPLWEDYYWRRVKTRVLKVNREHTLKYAA